MKVLNNDYLLKDQEEKQVAENMLVTQALDERDLLVKKIQDKIAKAQNQSDECNACRIICVSWGIIYLTYRFKLRFKFKLRNI